MIFRTDIQVRFNDTDAQGHLNNTSMALYVEQARVDFFNALEQPTRTLILANLTLDFRKQVHFGDVVHVETAVRRIGNTSVSLKQDVFAEGECATETTSVIVIFDYASARPTPVPEGLRQKLQSYLLPGGAA
jgi:acyl-CoA thioester hydrolase